MHEQNITIKEQEKLQIESDARMKHSHKLRGYAKKRRELGFDDEGQEEVEDEALDAYAEDLAKFEKQLQDKRDRKPIKVPTDVQGISKKEYLASMVKEVDKFKDV